MQRSLLLLSVFVVFLIVQATAAVAAPADLTRPVDAELRFCPEGEKCIARAVGDFNGDGIDDLVFERGSIFSRSSGQRQFELHLSPYVPDHAYGRDPARDRSATTRVTFRVAGAQSVEPVSVTDLDQDGLDDLVFYGGLESGAAISGAPPFNAFLFRGRTTWARSYRVDAPGTADLRIGPRPIDGLSGFVTSTQVSLASADVNADGQNDLLLAVDQALLPMDGPEPLAPANAIGSMIDIYFGAGPWPSRVDRAPDVQVSRIGSCVLSLAGTGDVTGDGLVDLVVRRCTSPQAPPQLRVVPGRHEWPATLAVEQGVNIPTAAPGIVPTVEPPVGGGYLPSTPLAGGLPPLVFLQDVSGDGILDIGLEFAGKTHLWHGSSTIADRVARNRASGIILKAGFGAAPLTRSWRMLDLDGDGRDDLALSRPMDPVNLACMASDCRSKGHTLGADGGDVLMYSGALSTRRVLDAALDSPDAVWSDPSSVLWGLGDFNGDGHDDLLLGSTPSAFDSIYSLVFGPLTRH
jgi:hypothetical protein